MELLVIMAALVAVIWVTAAIVRGSLLIGATWYLVITSVFGTYFARFDIGPINLSIDRLYLVALTAAFVVQIKLRIVTLRPWTFCDSVFAAYLAWVAISMVTHDFRTDKHGAVPIVQHYLNGYVIPAIVYAIVRNSRITDQDFRVVLGILTGFGVYLAITGVAEVTGQWWAVWPKYIANPELGLHYGRARGPMVQSVSYGLYLGVCLLAALLLRHSLARTIQPMIVATYPLLLAAVFLTKTRSIWAGTATAVGVYLWMTLSGRARIAVVLLGVLGAIGVVAAKSDAILFLKRETSAVETKKSADMRKAFAYVSWAMFLDRPIVGFGFGQFSEAKKPYLLDRTTDLDLESIRPYVHHNTFLAALTETGAVGLGLMLATLGALTRAAWHLARQDTQESIRYQAAILWLGVLGTSVWQMAGHEITFMTYEQSLIYFVAGLVVTLGQRSAEPNTWPEDVFEDEASSPRAAHIPRHVQRP